MKTNIKNNISSYSSFNRFLKYARPWKGRIILSSLYSILNKLFDIAPEILIGIAVDLVVQRQDSIIARIGFESIQSQITFLAIATFLVYLIISRVGCKPDNPEIADMV